MSLPDNPSNGSNYELFNSGGGRGLERSTGLLTSPHSRPQGQGYRQAAGLQGGLFPTTCCHSILPPDKVPLHPTPQILRGSPTSPTLPRTSHPHLPNAKRCTCLVWLSTELQDTHKVICRQQHQSQTTSLLCRTPAGTPCHSQALGDLHSHSPQPPAAPAVCQPHARPGPLHRLLLLPGTL